MSGCGNMAEEMARDNFLQILNSLKNLFLSENFLP